MKKLTALLLLFSGTSFGEIIITDKGEDFTIVLPKPATAIDLTSGLSTKLGTNSVTQTNGTSTVFVPSQNMVTTNLATKLGTNQVVQTNSTSTTDVPSANNLSTNLAVKLDSNGTNFVWYPQSIIVSNTGTASDGVYSLLDTFYHADYGYFPWYSNNNNGAQLVFNGPNSWQLTDGISTIIATNTTKVGTYGEAWLPPKTGWTTGAGTNPPVLYYTDPTIEYRNKLIQAGILATNNIAQTNGTSTTLVPSQNNLYTNLATKLSVTNATLQAILNTGSTATNANMAIGTTNTALGKVAIVGEAGAYTNKPLLYMQRTANGTSNMVVYADTNGLAKSGITFDGKFVEYSVSNSVNMKTVYSFDPTNNVRTFVVSPE